MGPFVPPHLDISIPEGEALADLRTVYRQWRATAQKWKQTAAFSLMPARVEKVNNVSKLFYGKDTYVKGDSVAVFSELTRQEFYGVLFSLNPSEVVVKMGDNSRARVLLTHLRHGRLSLYHYNVMEGGGGGGGGGDSALDWRDGGGGGGGGKKSKKRSAAVAMGGYQGGEEE